MTYRRAVVTIGLASALATGCSAEYSPTSAPGTTSSPEATPEATESTEVLVLPEETPNENVVVPSPSPEPTETKKPVLPKKIASIVFENCRNETSTGLKPDKTSETSSTVYVWRDNSANILNGIYKPYAKVPENQHLICIRKSVPLKLASFAYMVTLQKEAKNGIVPHSTKASAGTAIKSYATAEDGRIVVVTPSQPMHKSTSMASLSCDAKGKTTALGEDKICDDGKITQLELVQGAVNSNSALRGSLKAALLRTAVKESPVKPSKVNLRFIPLEK